jgi:hypothetical protein
VFRETHFGDLARVENVLALVLFEKELGTDSTPPDPAALVVEVNGHLAPTVLIAHPPLISLRFQSLAHDGSVLLPSWDHKYHSAHGLIISQTLIFSSDVDSVWRRRLSYRGQTGERNVGLPRHSRAC